MIPKFRVWDKINNRFVRISDFVIDTDGSIKEIGTELLDFGNDPSFEYMDLMQSTGIKDKNGAEIFVGDIVKLQAGHASFYTVEWHEKGMFIFRYIINKDQYYTFGEVNNFLNRPDYEILGNIYTNPELLKLQ